RLGSDRAVGMELERQAGLRLTTFEDPGFVLASGDDPRADRDVRDVEESGVGVVQRPGPRVAERAADLEADRDLDAGADGHLELRRDALAGHAHAGGERRRAVAVGL